MRPLEAFTLLSTILLTPAHPTHQAGAGRAVPLSARGIAVVVGLLLFLLHESGRYLGA